MGDAAESAVAETGSNYGKSTVGRRHSLVERSPSQGRCTGSSRVRGASKLEKWAALRQEKI